MAGSRRPRPQPQTAPPRRQPDAPSAPPTQPAVPPVPPIGGPRPLPNPSGWYVFDWIDAQGNRVAGHTPGAVGVMGVCVHRLLSTSIAARLAFMDAVLAIATVKAAGRPVFIALPGGFFGFDADMWWEETGDAWVGLALTTAQATAIRAHVQARIDQLAVGSAIAFGSDTGRYNAQQALCVVQRETPARVIYRATTPLANRHVQVGLLRATVFVCGEFTGSYTGANGPYHGALHLDDPAAQLAGTGLLVDLAHAFVRGTVEASLAGPRNVHQGQMEAFSETGASLLVHHHDGALAGAGHQRCDTASNWLLFRGGGWIGEAEVHPIP